MGIEVDFVPSLPSVVTDFYTLAEDLDIRSMREPLKRAIQQVIAPSFARNFQAEGRPAWQPLSERTVMDRGDTGPILKRSGRLKRTAQQLNIWTIDGNSGEAHISDLKEVEDYGYIQNFGGAGGQGSQLPARPWAMIEENEIDQVAEVFGVWVDERIAARMGMGI